MQILFPVFHRNQLFQYTWCLINMPLLNYKDRKIDFVDLVPQILLGDPGCVGVVYLDACQGEDQ